MHPMRWGNIAVTVLSASKSHAAILTAACWRQGTARHTDTIESLQPRFLRYTTSRDPTQVESRLTSASSVTKPYSSLLGTPSGQGRGPSRSSTSQQRSTIPARRIWQVFFWLPVAGFVLDKCVSLGSISGGSMSPSLNPLYPTHGVSAPRDIVVLNRLAAARHIWRVGDVVVLISPSDPRVLLTKRILALPGDVVMFVDTQKVSSENGKDAVREVKVWSRLRIPPGHCWVEGDSSVAQWPEARTNSSALRVDPTEAVSRGILIPKVDVSQDSRHFGPVPLALLTARVSAIVWPIQRFGMVPCRPGCTPVSFPGTAGRKKRGWWLFGEKDKPSRHPLGTKSHPDQPANLGIREPEDSVLTSLKSDQTARKAEAKQENDTIDLPIGYRIAERMRITSDKASQDPSTALLDLDGDPPNTTLISSSLIGKEANRQQRREMFNSISRGGQLGETLD